MHVDLFGKHGRIRTIPMPTWVDGDRRLDCSDDHMPAKVVLWGVLSGVLNGRAGWYSGAEGGVSYGWGKLNGATRICASTTALILLENSQT